MVKAGIEHISLKLKEKHAPDLIILPISKISNSFSTIMKL